MASGRATCLISGSVRKWKYFDKHTEIELVSTTNRVDYKEYAEVTVVLFNPLHHIMAGKLVSGLRLYIEGKLAWEKKEMPKGGYSIRARVIATDLQKM
jgi:single-stranded DNA-binding protein